MSDLGLNIHHTEVIANYMAFTKLQRVQNLRTIDGLFQDVFDSRLLDSSYTIDEVQEILYSLRKLLKGELESGLMDVNHMNVLLLQQVFSQAENWHLKLEINMSELQNRSLLEVVREIDQNGFAPMESRMKKSDDPNDPIGLLQLEIKKLQKDITANEEEIVALKSKLADHEKDRHNLEIVNSQKMDSTAEYERKINQLQEKIGELEAELLSKDDKMQQNFQATSDSQEFQTIKEKLLRAQSQLKLAEQELDRKFKETTAFTNMKKLLDRKNEQMKIMREKLKNIEVMEYEKSDESENECSV